MRPHLLAIATGLALLALRTESGADELRHRATVMYQTAGLTSEIVTNEVAILRLPKSVVRQTPGVTITTAAPRPKAPTAVAPQDGGATTVIQRPGSVTTIGANKRGLLNVRMEADRYQAAPTETVRFIVTLTNVGLAPVDEITVYDALPAELKFVRVQAQPMPKVEATAHPGGTSLVLHFAQPLAEGKELRLAIEATVADLPPLPKLVIAIPQAPPVTPQKPTPPAKAAPTPKPVRPTPPLPPAPLPGDVRIGYADFRNTTVSEVCARLATKTGVPIEFKGATNPAVPTFTLVNVDLHFALETLAKQHSLAVTKTATGFVVGT